MTNMAIEKFVTCRINKADFDKLNEEIAAAVAVSCFAVNEINLLRRLYLFSHHEYVENEAIDLINSFQWIFLMRMLSAKVFDFFKFFDDLSKSKCPALIALRSVGIFEERRAALVKSDSYLVARALRNEATSHYSLSAALKNTKHLDARSDFSLYLHRIPINDFYLFGEEILFAGRIRRQVASSGNSDSAKSLGSWLDWITDVIDWIQEFNSELLHETVMPILASKSNEERTYWIPEQMVGAVEVATIPLIARRRND